MNQSKTFADLALAEPLLRALGAAGLVTPTPIQAEAIPALLDGRDMLGIAQTGTGKTAAFGLPLLQHLARRAEGLQPRSVRALILAPTRELAMQIDEELRKFGRFLGIRHALVFGGVGHTPQIRALEKGVDILVATPGRLLDHLDAGVVKLDRVQYLVLDEADRMLDIGFLPDLQRILSYLPKQRTTLLFSATFSPEIKRLAGSYLQDPITVEVARSNATASTVEQHFYRVDDDDKRGTLRQILRERGLKQAFVFVNSKLGCARLARSLERDGLNTAALHGDKSQDERLKALDAFKQGNVDLLVCTDVAARGLDIKDVPAVFNFDIPFNAEDYVHRIGRTGRAGASGLAVSFVSGRDARLVGELEKLLGKKLEIEALELEQDRRPAGRFNDGQRAWQREGSGREGADNREARESREPRGVRAPAPRAARAPADPFFDQPYEAKPAGDAPPQWETAQRANAPKGLSPNIKQRRKVPALFKSSAPPPAAS